MITAALLCCVVLAQAPTSLPPRQTYSTYAPNGQRTGTVIVAPNGDVSIFAPNGRRIGVGRVPPSGYPVQIGPPNGARPSIIAPIVPMK